MSGGTKGRESARLEPDERKWERVADIFQKLQLDNGPINLFSLFQSVVVLHFFSRLACDRINFFLFFLLSLIVCPLFRVKRRSGFDPSHRDDSYNSSKQLDLRRLTWSPGRTSSPSVWPYLFWRLRERPARGLQCGWWRAMIQGERPRWEKTWGLTALKRLIHFKTGWTHLKDEFKSSALKQLFWESMFINCYFSCSLHFSISLTITKWQKSTCLWKKK